MSPGRRVLGPGRQAGVSGAPFGCPAAAPSGTGSRALGDFRRCENLGEEILSLGEEILNLLSRRGDSQSDFRRGENR